MNKTNAGIVAGKWILIPVWIGVVGTVLTLIFQSLGPGFVVDLFKYNLQYNYGVMALKTGDILDDRKRIGLVCQIRNTGENYLSEIVLLFQSYNPDVTEISVVPEKDLEELPPVKSEAFVECTTRLKDRLLPGQSKFIEFVVMFGSKGEDLDAPKKKIELNSLSALNSLALKVTAYSNETTGIYNKTLGSRTGTNYKPRVTLFVKAVAYVFLQIAVWIVMPLVGLLFVVFLLILLARYLLTKSRSTSQKK